MDLEPNVRTRMRTETVAQWIKQVLSANRGKETTRWPLRAKVPQHLIPTMGATIVFIDANGNYTAKGSK